MDEKDIKIIRALSDCVFLPGSGPKSFVGKMSELVKDSPDYILSDRQWYYLQTLYHSYRGQIRDHEYECLICKALEKNQAIINLVCPGCGYHVGAILKPKTREDIYCPRCLRFRMSQFELTRIRF